MENTQKENTTSKVTEPKFFYLSVNMDYYDEHCAESNKERLQNHTFLMIGKYESETDSIFFYKDIMSEVVINPITWEPDHSIHVRYLIEFHKGHKGIVLQPIVDSYIKLSLFTTHTTNTKKQKIDSIESKEINVNSILKYSIKNTDTIPIKYSWKKDSTGNWLLHCVQFSFTKEQWNQQMKHIVNSWNYLNSSDKSFLIIN